MTQTNKTCEECGKSFSTRLPQQRYCGSECGKSHTKRTCGFASLAKELGISPSTIGAISEYRVCIDLLQKGYNVYRAVSMHSPADILAYKTGGPTLKIEVRTAYERGEKLYYPRKRREEGIILAAVTTTRIVYDGEI